MKKLLSFLIMLIAFTYVNTTCSQNKKEQLDSLFKILEKENQAMGSIAILKKGKVFYQNASGYKNLEKKIPAQPNTLYRVGSITKTYTATMIMQLVEDNKLDLDQKLAAFYPKVKNADSISIDMLLRHRSGIFNFTNEEDYLKRAEKPTSKQDILNRIYKYESVFKPGSKFGYSNTNYMLLTFIIEDVTGNSYQEVLKENILKPLDLSSTFYKFPDTPTLSYVPANPWKKEMSTDVSVPRGAGAIIASATDVALFFNALFKGQLVNKENLRQMKSIEGQYGIGLFQIPFYELKGYGHTGGIDGFRSNAAYFESEELSIAYLSNGANYPLNDIMIKSLSIYFEKDFEYPDFSVNYNHSPQELQALTGTYSTPQFPLKIKISYEDGQLKGQATGQPEFTLRAVEKNSFEFKPANLKMNFQPKKKSLTLIQNGQNINFNKTE